MADDGEEVVDVPLLQAVVVLVIETALVADHDDLVKDDDDVLKDLVRAIVVHVVVVLVDVKELVLDLLVDDAVALVDELSVVALSDADLDVSHLVDLVVNSLFLIFVDVAYLYVVVNLLVVELDLFVVD